MPRGWWAVAVLVCTVAAGCLPRSGGPAGTTRVRSPGPAAPAEGVSVQSVLIEQPVGDPFLNRDLWAAGWPATGPQARALLAENGLRAAVIGGNLPPRFQALLESEPDTVSPHRLTFATRKDAVLPTAGPIDWCEYEVLAGLAGKPERVELRQARCGVLVRPDPTPDGRVQVWCEPQVQHGDRQDRLRPTADGTQFVLQGEVPLEKYPSLGFDVALGPNDYLLIGWDAERGGTLGEAMFAVEAGGRPRQRVLVVRAARAGDAPPDDLPAAPDPPHRPSIAAEAGRPGR
jgi:hypothetical protein